ncbi:MAG: HtaA domain-containing protein, partial [Pseudolysinimonas sp.]
TFGWSSTQGNLDPSTAKGAVDFPGSVEFTGHGGVLDTTISHPVLVLRGPSDAVLKLDVSGPSMEGDQIAVQGAEFVSIDLAGQNLTPVSGVISIVNAPTALTAAGYAAFPDYPAGTAFDPISAHLDVGDCDLVGETIVKTPGWLLPVIGGGVVVVLAGVAAVVVIRRRRNVSA